VTPSTTLLSTILSTSYSGSSSSTSSTGNVSCDVGSFFFFFTSITFFDGPCLGLVEVSLDSEDSYFFISFSDPSKFPSGSQVRSFSLSHPFHFTRNSVTPSTTLLSTMLSTSYTGSSSSTSSTGNIFCDFDFPFFLCTSISFFDGSCLGLVLVCLDSDASYFLISFSDPTKFSLGSQVLSSSFSHPFHFTRYSVFPSTSLLSTILSTSNSESSSETGIFPSSLSNFFFCLFSYLSMIFSAPVKLSQGSQVLSLASQLCHLTRY